MIRLLNSRASVRRAAAIALSIVPILIVLGIFFAMQASLAGAKLDVLEKRRLLGRLVASAARLSELELVREPLSDTETGTFLSGQSEATIRASLQQNISERATRSRVEVVSIGNAPNKVENDVVYVGLQANVTGTTAFLREFLVSVETAKPVLFIPELTIRSVGSQSRTNKTVETSLVAQLRIYGALNPDHLLATEPGSRQ